MAETGGLVGRTQDAVVIGGGLIGLSIAWRLARENISVTLIEKGEVGREASWAGAGMVSVQVDARHSTDPDFIQLCIASLERYPSFIEEVVAESGIDVEYHQTGSLYLSTVGANLCMEMVNTQKLLGLNADLLKSDELTSRIPGIDPRYRFGVHLLKDQHVQNRRLTEALGAACVQRGVEILQETEVIGFEMEGDRVTGIRTERGGLSAEMVVLAAGAWSSEFTSALGFSVPTRPVKGQMLAMKVDHRLPCIVHNDDVYLVPWNNEILYVGASVEEAGFDRKVNSETTDSLKAGALRILPRLVEADVVETWTGFRPGSPDLMPMLGASPLEGLIIATGHFRSGILLAPITGDLVAELATTGRTERDLIAFDVCRFATASAE